MSYARDTHSFLRYDTEMEWAKKRKIFYVVAFVGIILLVLIPVVYLVLHKEPTCFDGSQNGSEAGVDCGGPCSLYCAFEMKPLRTAWVKSFPFAPGHYDIGAYIENPNQNAGIPFLRYTVRAFDAEGKTIAERTGALEVGPGSSILLFEGNFSSEILPVRAEVDFDIAYQSAWRKAKRAEAKLVTKNYVIRYTDVGPRFDAVVVNTDPVTPVGSTVVGAIIFDETRNPVAISRTIVDGIAKGSEQPVFFTWPEQFAGVQEGDKLITDLVIMQSAEFQK